MALINLKRDDNKYMLWAFYQDIEVANFIIDKYLWKSIDVLKV